MKNIDELERRRLADKDELLKKFFSYRDTNVEDSIIDLSRRVKDLELETFRPKEPLKQKFNIEDEKIIKDIVQGMADFESDNRELRRVVAEHDSDIQGAAKLIEDLNQQNNANTKTFQNHDRRLGDLERLKEIVAKDKVENAHNVEALRLACEDEFNNVKKAEISDFNNLNNKVNSLVGLQDVVEDLASQVEYLQQDVDGVRK